MEHILLIDGKNTAYRALYAARGNQEFQNAGQHPFVVWLRFAHVWYEKFKPVAIHVFWDCPKNDVWRKKILNEYKDNRDGSPHYSDDVYQDMNRIINAAQAILPCVNIRQYERPGQECDDLIYSMCRILTPPRSDMRKVIIISSDSDFVQVQWSMPHVVVYEPRKGVFVDTPEVNPVITKALAGDESDNVDGYRGIGPVKSKQLADNLGKLVEFLDVTGDQKFKRNMALIDMSLNPMRLNNELYLIRAMQQLICFDKTAIQDAINKYKILGLMADYTRLMLPFKNLQ